MVQLMNAEQEHSFQLAGEKLLKSKKMMKKQYDKKVIIRNKKEFQINDEVFIENMSKKRSQGGKLQDKWIGPYPITKVTNSILQVSKSKTVQRVKKYKVKIVKRPHPDPISTSPSKIIKLDPIDENLSAYTEDFFTSSLFIGSEEFVFTTQEQMTY